MTDPVPKPPLSSTSPTGGGDSSERPASGLRSPPFSSYTLRDGQHEIALHEGETLIGRSSECSLILDGALVSRRHAVLSITGDRVTLRDLGSRNGTSVNDDKLEGSVELTEGARLVLGNVALELVKRTPRQGRPSTELRRAQTMSIEAVHLDTEPAPDAKRTVADDTEENTHAGHVFDLLGGVVDKALAMGKTADAARVLSGPIDRVWKDARAGRSVDPDLAERAADYAVRLAAGTRDERWIGKAIDIFAAQKRPLPLGIIDQLYTIVRHMPGSDHKALEGYVRALEQRRESLSAAERFALKRLEGLLRVARS